MAAADHLEVWRDRARVERYGRLQGWVDDGERVALASVADEVRGRPLLDLGVGAGRTAWLLRLLSDDYLGIDWSPEMVAACRELVPGASVRVGDARDLRSLPASHFALALFSFNGIDNLDHEGRDRAVGELARVLCDGGLFVYATFSKLGPAYSDRPRLVPERHPAEPLARFAARALLRAPAAASGLPARRAAWRSSARHAENHGGWGTAPVEALDFALAHFTTVGEERRLLAAHGLALERVLGGTGHPVQDDGRGCAWLHLVARKSGA